MKAIILAAGVGRRLKPYTDKMPKCLIKINGKTILERQLKVLRQCGIADILVICGFQADKVKKFCRTRRINFLFNPWYATTNSVISLWLTKDLWDRDVLIMNSDIVIEHSLLRKIIDTEYPAAVLVNARKDGYRVRLSDGYVADMRMDIPDKQTFGAYAGITLMRKKELGRFKDMLELWIENGWLNDWYEDVVVGLIKGHKVKVRPILTGRHLWMEIDTAQDLMLARVRLKNSKL